MRQRGRVPVRSSLCARTREDCNRQTHSHRPTRAPRWHRQHRLRDVWQLRLSAGRDAILRLRLQTECVMTLQMDAGGSSAGGDAPGGENFIVAVRLRPTSEPENAVVRVDSRTALSITVAERGSEAATHSFLFDQVYDGDAEQASVFQRTAQRAVLSAMDGVNATVFAYGQTGTGKTFTMEGTREQPGVIPRAFDLIFARAAEEKSAGASFLLRASFCQIYNETVVDLLAQSAADQRPLKIREDAKGGVYVQNLSQWVVRERSDCGRLLTRGNELRAVAATRMNAQSSRSHAVFTLVVEQSGTKTGAGRVRVARLNLVDLAGSERVRDTGADGKRLDEARSINQSLAAFGNVISALAQRAKGQGAATHVPYRDSKLTRMLQTSLGGNCRTALIATISADYRAAQESLSTLRFAARARNVRARITVNEEASGGTVLARYENEIKALKAQLATHTDQLRHFMDAEMQRTQFAQRLAATTEDLERERREREDVEKRLQHLQSQLIGAGSASTSGAVAAAPIGRSDTMGGVVIVYDADQNGGAGERSDEEGEDDVVVGSAGPQPSSSKSASLAEAMQKLDEMAASLEMERVERKRLQREAEELRRKASAFESSLQKKQDDTQRKQADVRAGTITLTMSFGEAARWMLHGLGAEGGMASFTGKDLVEWTMRNGGVAPDTAREVAQHLMDAGHLRRVDGRSRFSLRQQMTFHGVALHEAAMAGDVEKLRRLIGSSGSKLIDTRDADGRTALMYAISTGREDCARLLLDSGASLTARDKDKHTALLWAVHTSQPKFVRMLMAKGADWRHLDARARTALHWCARNADAGCLRAIVESLPQGDVVRPTDLNAGDDEGLTPLHWAAMYGGREQAKQLIALGANVRATDIELKTALHFAAAGNAGEIVRVLLAADDKNPSACDLRAITGHTPLHLACGAGAESALVHLLAQKPRANLGLADDQGRTVLHYSAARGDVACVNRLIGAGADPWVVDSHGRTPRDYTEFFGASHGDASSFEKCARRLEDAEREWSRRGKGVRWRATPFVPTESEYSRAAASASKRPQSLADSFSASFVSDGGDGGSFYGRNQTASPLPAALATGSGMSVGGAVGPAVKGGACPTCGRRAFMTPATPNLRAVGLVAPDMTVPE